MYQTARLYVAYSSSPCAFASSLSSNLSVLAFFQGLALLPPLYPLCSGICVPPHAATISSRRTRARPMATKHSTWHVVSVKAYVAAQLFALFALFATSGCEQKVAGGSTNGAAVFQSVCAACHGATGKPSEANVARLGVKDLT